MALSAILVIWLAAGCAGEQLGTASTRQRSLEAEWAHELTPDTKVKTYVGPAKRVINLLTKMKAELQAEADKEAEMYDKMVCWCEQNEKEKTQSVADAEARDRELSAEIESRSAKFGDLSASIANTKKEIAANTEALRTATAIREAEAAKFKVEEKDMVQAVTNLRNAIAVLSKHQKTQSLLQMDGSVLSGLRVLLRDTALKYEVMVAGNSERRGETGAHRSALLSLKVEGGSERGSGAQGLDTTLLHALDLDSSMSDSLPLKFAAQLVAKAALPSHGQGTKFLQVAEAQPLYESRSSHRSATIFGVMTQMLEEFEAELTTEQKDELRGQADFQALAAAKTAEIAAGKKKLDEMQADDAGNKKALSDAKEDLALTRDVRSADVKFLHTLKINCNDLDAQWEKRSQTRAAETKAVSEAIAILTQDDNREHLFKTVALFQEDLSVAASTSAKRASAASLLRRAADAPDFEADDLLAAWHGRHVPSLGAAAGPHAQLSTLAMAVQLDSFTDVKKLMDKMIVNLKQEQADEVEFKAYCVTELNSNEKTTYAKNERKNELQTNIQHLETLVANLQNKIAEEKSQIARTQLEIKKASQTREEENAEFQTVVADQRATQAILTKALQKLKDFYQKGIGNVVSLSQKAAQEPPVKFNSYKVNSGSTPVIGLLEQIMEDSKALEAETTSAEYQAQSDYENFVSDSNGLIHGLQSAITSQTKAVAAAHSDAAVAQENLANTISELDSLTQYETDLHNQCDFVLKNFDIRQRARLQEIEAIQAAKAILSGTK